MRWRVAFRCLRCTWETLALIHKKWKAAALEVSKGYGITRPKCGWVARRRGPTHLSSDGPPSTCFGAVSASENSLREYDLVSHQDVWILDLSALRFSHHAPAGHREFISYRMRRGNSIEQIAFYMNSGFGEVNRDDTRHPPFRVSVYTEWVPRFTCRLEKSRIVQRAQRLMKREISPSCGSLCLINHLSECENHGAQFDLHCITRCVAKWRENILVPSIRRLLPLSFT